jgi:hypothetical protein
VLTKIILETPLIPQVMEGHPRQIIGPSVPPFEIQKCHLLPVGLGLLRHMATIVVPITNAVRVSGISGIFFHLLEEFPTGRSSAILPTLSAAGEEDNDHAEEQHDHRCQYGPHTDRVVGMRTTTVGIDVVFDDLYNDALENVGHRSQQSKLHLRRTQQNRLP